MCEGWKWLAMNGDTSKNASLGSLMTESEWIRARGVGIVVYGLNVVEIGYG
jgi:hypothetical protein